MDTHTSLAAQFTLHPSLHPTLLLQLTIPRSHTHTHTSCHLHTFIHLPDSLFLDPYQLNDLWGHPILPQRESIDRLLLQGRKNNSDVGIVNRPALWYLTPNETDLERPVFLQSTIQNVVEQQQQQTTLHLVLDNLPAEQQESSSSNKKDDIDIDIISEINIEIPLHARYLQPSPSTRFPILDRSSLLTFIGQAIGVLPNIKDKSVIRIGGTEDESADVVVQGWYACMHDVPSTEIHNHNNNNNNQYPSFLSNLFFPSKQPPIPIPDVTLHAISYTKPPPPSSSSSSSSSSTTTTTTTLPRGDLSHLPFVQIGTMVVVWVMWIWIGREVWKTGKRWSGKS